MGIRGKRKHVRATCLKCGKEAPHPQHRKYCSRECERSHVRACPCGRLFTGSARRLYCSTECSTEARRRRHPGSRSAKGRSGPPVALLGVNRTRECPTCGESFSMREHNVHTVYCSHDCAMAARTKPCACGRPREAYRTADGRKRRHGTCETCRAKAKQPKPPPPPPPPLDPRTCPHCQAEFQPKRETQRYCSKRHKSYAAHRRHRLWKGKAGRSSLNTIGERDGWVCQLCGYAVWRNAPAHHPLGPTRDHIVPRSHGGTWEPANLRMAHRGCNAYRQDGDHDGRPHLWWADQTPLEWLEAA